LEAWTPIYPQAAMALGGTDEFRRLAEAMAALQRIV
jgi:hypothetical protein